MVASVVVASAVVAKVEEDVAAVRMVEGGGGRGEGYCCELQAVTPAITNVRPVGGVQTSNTNTQR